MGFDSWGVMPDLDEDKFVLAFRDSSPAQGKPFMRTSDPMPEEWIRAELKEGGISQELIDSSIAKAKEQWKKDNP
jgi:hypothetical protein